MRAGVITAEFSAVRVRPSSVAYIFAPPRHSNDMKEKRRLRSSYSLLF